MLKSGNAIYEGMMTVPDQESRAAYLNARKSGRKYVSEHSDMETKGYLPVLDYRLRNVVIVGEINLGNHEIPLSKIIGTKTAARSNSFAGNFMPLLAEDTEFAIKWQNVYSSQLNEGIREPVKVYEYINRYYTLEGNKRVSILKFVEAASVYGNIIRLLPERDESNAEISIYYEFLDYDKKLFFDNLWFSKKGNFTRLVEHTEQLLESRPEIKDDVETVINQTFRSFRTAYKSAGFSGVKLTSGDAFVEYINVFGYPYNIDARTLKKNIKNAGSQFMLASGEIIKDTIEVSAKESTLLQSRPSFFRMNNKIRAAIVYGGTPELSIWSRAHARAIERVEKNHPGDLKVLSLYNLPAEPDTAYEELSRLAAEKPDILFTTSPTMSDVSLRIALENPSTIVLNCDVAREGKNLHTYFYKMYDLTFLCGVLAAAVSETGKIGYMSAATFAEIAGEGSVPTYDLNAFAIGARMINPRVQILDFMLRGMNDWSEHDEARAAFAKLGADTAFCRHSPDNPLDRKAFPEVYAQLYSLDRKTGVPLESLAAATLDWEPFYHKVIHDAILGKASLLKGHIDGSPIHFGWGFSTGIMDVFPVNSVIGIAGRLLRIFRDLMKTGSLNPFEGPIYDNAGNMRIDWNYVPTLTEIQDMDWYESAIRGVNY